MKRDANTQPEALQRSIDEQEQAMAAILTRVMKQPLDPLHKTLCEMTAQLAAVQQANARSAQAVEAGLIEALENQYKRVRSRFDEVADGIGELKEDLCRHSVDQKERDGRMQDSLLRADGMLAQLDANADATGVAIEGVVREITRVEDGLSAVRAQQQAVADQLSRELDGMGVRFEQRHTHLDDGLTRTATILGQIDTRTSAVGDSLTAATQAVAKVDADLVAMRDQEWTAASELNRELNGLTRQLDSQQAQLYKRIDTLQPGLVSHFESLAATIEGSSKEVARQYQVLSETQQALVTATVQQQLALHLAPLQTRTKWLFAVCVLSLSSTMALLGLQLFR